MMEDIDDIEAEEVSVELGGLFLSDGDIWVRDPEALCDEFKILALSMYDGVAGAFVASKGFVKLDDLIKSRKSAKVVALTKNST